jgi:hypothetical protein
MDFKEAGYAGVDLIYLATGVCGHGSEPSGPYKRHGIFLPQSSIKFSRKMTATCNELLN